mgnify:CR=1 FL=1
MENHNNIFNEFLHPGTEYTPIPFWFWNDRLDKEIIRKQIKDFYEKGVEGFVLHPRIGIPQDIEYLSDSFMEFVAFAVEEAHKLGMQVILYDEAMYPSGAANGKVVQSNPKFASRGLRAMVYESMTFPTAIDLEEDERIVSIYIVNKEENDYDPGNIFSIYPEQEMEYYTISIEDREIHINSSISELMDGQQMIILSEGYTEGTIRGIHELQDDGQKNAPRSADLLNPEAVKAFIGFTHERYREVVGDYFGNTIIGMFTDEPDITGRNSKPGYIPWTNGFERRLFGYGHGYKDLIGLFFEVGNDNNIRQDYDRAINEQMLASYYEPISEWCKRHQLSLTGHPEKSDDIGLLKSFHIPGQDVVWRWVAPEMDKGVTGEHSTAGKCGADAARHYGRRRNINEFLGVCGKNNTWNLSAADMKWYTDWLAVRGVNLFCPHAFYYSVEGKVRSHERPPDVGPNNVWWPYYQFFSNYMKRLSWLMTDSVNEANIGILSLNNHLPWKMARIFYENQTEFNYIHEDLFLSKRVTLKGDTLEIEQQRYHVIILDDIPLDQFNPKVVTVLYNFIANGGKVYAISSSTPSKQFKHIHYLSYNQHNLLNFFSPFQTIRLVTPAPHIRVTKVWKGKRFFYYLVNEGEEPFNGYVKFLQDIPFEAWNAWTGERFSLVVESENQAYLQLGYRESLILTAATNSEALPILYFPSSDSHQEKNVQLIAPGKSGFWNYSMLRDWQEIEELAYYSGTLDYLFHFNWDSKKKESALLLDLGNVYEIAEVIVNNKLVGVKMWAPYHFILPEEYLKDGDNEILVKVTNNSTVAMDRQALPSGLIGPVTMKLVPHEGEVINESYILSE